MRPIATDVARSVVCLSVCRSHGYICTMQKRLNRSRCRLGLTLVGPRNHVYRINRWGLDRTNPFSPMRGDKSATRHFAKLLWTLLLFIRQNVLEIWQWSHSQTGFKKIYKNFCNFSTNMILTSYYYLDTI